MVVKPGGGLTPGSIQEFCRSRLAGFKVPTVIEFLDELPKTSIGKVEKKRLRTLA